MIGGDKHDKTGSCATELAAMNSESSAVSGKAQRPAKVFVRAVVCGAVLAVMAAVGILISRHHDEVRLSALAQSIAGSEKLPSAKALAILHFVYHNHGFRKNPSYFVIPQFGPTAVQVLDAGGDCNDRSRLMVAVLKQAGITATPVMLFDDLMHPSHTVVEASVESGPMDLDPTYDLYFPRATGGFYSSADLRENPGLLTSRLEEMRRVDPKAAHYHLNISGYSHASTFNWDKNSLTQVLGRILVRLWGNRAYQLTRPSVLEDPKLSAAVFLVVVASLTLASVPAASWVSKQMKSKDASATPLCARATGGDR